MERASVLLVLVVLAAYMSICSAQNTGCILSSYASRGDCNFYTCLESQKRCGSSGYALGYGYKYCTRFGQYIHNFDSKGQQWVNNVRRCLMNALVRYNPSRRSCSQIRTYAFKSHPRCYLRSSPGFCRIATSNLCGLAKVFEYQDFFSWQSFTQVVKTLYGCVVGRGKRPED